jgi:hypothetical protein
MSTAAGLTSLPMTARRLFRSSMRKKDWMLWQAVNRVSAL